MKSDADRLFQTHIVNWMYHFTSQIETEAQEKDSMFKLEAFLDKIEEEGVVSAILVSFTRTFLRESFKPVLDLLCFRNYIDIYCGDVDENCFTESDNAALRSDVMGPSANAHLFTSAHSITQHTKRRMNKLASKATTSYEKQILPKASDSVADRCKVKLSKDIVEYKRDIVVEQFEQSQGEFMNTCY